MKHSNDLLTCFLWICNQDTNYWCVHVSVYSCKHCAECTGLSLKRVRDAMKRLAQYGYVKLDHDGGYDEWYERLYCVRGYAVTRKGRDTAIWKNIERKAIEEIERSLRNDYG